MIKIAHIADLHLDSSFATLSASEREKRRLELRDALCSVCETCREEKVDILLIAGDLFESDCVLADTPEFCARCFSEIPETQIFISPGNHDPYSARSPYRSASFSDNVHIFTEPKITAIDLPQLNTTVYGYGFEERVIKGNPLERFCVKDKSRINILCAHAELGAVSPVYCGMSTESLTASYLDYAALGHIHTPSGFKKYGKTVCAYSGCLVGRGYDECGKRGAIIGEITTGGVSLKYRVIANRHYEAIDLDVTERDGEEEIVAKIKAACGDFDENASVKVTLRGNVKERVAPSQNRLRLELPSLYEIILSDETILIPDLSSLLTEQSLRGEFCRRLLPHLNSEDEQERRKAAMALEIGMRAMGK